MPRGNITQSFKNGGGGSVKSVTGLDTDNTDPQNPVVKISVDGDSVVGEGTPLSPLSAPHPVIAISGNTAGVTGIISTGTAVFNGGSNITLSQNGNNLTINAASQTAQTLGMFAVSNTTGTTSSQTIDARTISFNGAGIASIGFNAGSVIISATQGTDVLGISNLGNTAGTSGVISAVSPQFLLAGGNNVTLSQSLNGASATVTINAAAQTVQTQGWTAIGNTTASTSSTSFNSNFSISGAGIISAGFSGNSIVLSATTAQSIQTHNIIAVGNTTGSTSSTNFGTILSFSGAGIASVGFSGDTVIISASSNQSVQTEGWSAVGNTTGSTSSTVFNSNFSLSGAGVASVGFSGNTIIISASSTQSVQTQGWTAIGQTTGSTSSTSFNSNFSISGAGGASVGFSGNTIIVSGATGGGAAAITLSKSYFGITAGTTQASAIGSATATIQYCPIANNISISRACVFISVSPQTSAAASSGSWSATLAMGIYTRNGTSLSTFMATSSALYTTGWTSNTNSANVTGARLISVPFATLLTPNEYWIMVGMSTATGANLSASQSIYVCPVVVGGAASQFGTWGGAIISGAMVPGAGTIVNNASTLPASMGMITQGPTGGPLGGYSAPIIQVDNYSIT